MLPYLTGRWVRIRNRMESDINSRQASGINGCCEGFAARVMDCKQPEIHDWEGNMLGLPNSQVAGSLVDGSTCRRSTGPGVLG